MELIEKEIFHRSFTQIINGVKTFYVKDEKIVEAANELLFRLNLRLNQERNNATEKERDFLFNNINIMEN